VRVLELRLEVRRTRSEVELEFIDKRLLLSNMKLPLLRNLLRSSPLILIEIPPNSRLVWHISPNNLRPLQLIQLLTSQWEPP